MQDNTDDYEASKITIQTEDRWCEVPEWNKFQAEKQAIKDKYPSQPWVVTHKDGRGNYKNPFEQEWWDDWQAYKKELTDLMLDEYGNFSKFLFEIRPEREDLKTRIWLRGAYHTDAYKKKRS